MPIHRLTSCSPTSNMPGAENGLILASWVREHFPNIKVILTSGVANITTNAGDPRMDGACTAETLPV